VGVTIHNIQDLGVPSSGSITSRMCSVCPLAPTNVRVLSMNESSSMYESVPTSMTWLITWFKTRFGLNCPNTTLPETRSKQKIRNFFMFFFFLFRKNELLTSCKELVWFVNLFWVHLSRCGGLFRLVCCRGREVFTFLLFSVSLRWQQKWSAQQPWYSKIGQYCRWILWIR
jgi:hypothetical protein